MWLLHYGKRQYYFWYLLWTHNNMDLIFQFDALFAITTPQDTINGLLNLTTTKYVCRVLSFLLSHKDHFKNRKLWIRKMRFHIGDNNIKDKCTKGAFSVAKRIGQFLWKSYQNKMRGKFRIKVFNNIPTSHKI